MTTIHAILEQFREAATSNRDLGDKFERLIANLWQRNGQQGIYPLLRRTAADMAEKWPNVWATETYDPGTERKKA